VSLVTATVIATSPLYGVLFDLCYSFFLFDQSVMAVTDFSFVPRHRLELAPSNKSLAQINETPGTIKSFGP
jgi:hypothetical protein